MQRPASRIHRFDSGSRLQFDFAGIAQLVERNLAKVEVASSSLVSRSRPKVGKCRRCFPNFFITGAGSPLHAIAMNRSQASRLTRWYRAVLFRAEDQTMPSELPGFSMPADPGRDWVLPDYQGDRFSTWSSRWRVCSVPRHRQT